MKKKLHSGFSIVEILVSIGIFSIIVFSVFNVFLVSQEAARMGSEKTKAIPLLNEYLEKIRNIRRMDWNLLTNNRFIIVENQVTHNLELQPTVAGETIGNHTRYLDIADACRDATGVLVVCGSGGDSIDPSSKKITVTISWTGAHPGQLVQSTYLTRYLDNLAWMQTLKSDFDAGTNSGTQTAYTGGSPTDGEVQIAANNRARWCTPEFSTSTIDLPDGPPVAVAAKAYSALTTPNDVFAAVAPQTSTVVKLAYVQVPANVDPPAPIQRGIFTLDSSRYSAGTFPAGLDIDNSFKTNDVTYYQSPAGKVYALLATDLPAKEVVVVQINDGTGDAYQDPVNHIYKYWTYFNTRNYVGSTSNLNTGNLSPTANTADSGGDGNGFQTNPTYAYGNDSNYAADPSSGTNTNTTCGDSGKDRHRYYNYNVSLPAGSSIAGIEVRLDARIDSTSGASTRRMCAELSWDGGATWTAAKQTGNLSTSMSTYTLGGSTDNWGHVWSIDELSNANFRLRITNVANSTSREFRLDWAAVNVHYSVPANDQAPFGYGAKSVTVLNDRGYVASGGYLYAFDLSTIDQKLPASELDQVGCRIELDGFDCLPGSGTDRKYSAGETGSSWSSTAGAAHSDCSDGGNIELFADNDLSGVTVSGSNYIFVAVGAGTNPELNIVNATSIPDGSSNPTISSSSCGRISGGNNGWKRVGSLDFNNTGGTEEAANSVFAKSDGSRAYISSNGGIDANNDTQPDSKQFYIINTVNKSSPAFLSGSGSGPTSGYYYGADPNDDLFPRQSLTVLNGQRAVVVGKDGYPANIKNPKDYQVLDITAETWPTYPSYCGGLDFDEGFNDLTSVSEADGDNFVYMVANTNLNELKIIQGGPDGTYLASGTFESQTLNTNFPTAFNRFFINSSVPGPTTLRYQVAVKDASGGSCDTVTFSDFDFVGPGGLFTAFFNADDAVPLDDSGSGYENPGQCMRFRAYFSTTDYDQTPKLLDFTVNYSP